MSAPSFIHSDVGRGLLAAKRAGWPIDTTNIQASLVAFIAEQSGSGMDGVVFPGFNYDYGGTRVFDVQKDPVQVGAVAEWARTAPEFKRTEVPFFSFVSRAKVTLRAEHTINPFGSNSGFSWLVENDANIILFGAPFHTLTFIHYVEEATGGPIYRYTKQFPGTIQNGAASRACNFAMHVRPMGVVMDYDWPRLEADLVEQKILLRSDDVQGLSKVNAKRLLQYWGNLISDDPFYLVNQATKDEFWDRTNSGSHRVLQEEFEDV